MSKDDSIRNYYRWLKEHFRTETIVRHTLRFSNLIHTRPEAFVDQLRKKGLL